MRREIEGLIGFFLNTLALRIDLSGEPSVGELLARVKQRAIDVDVAKMFHDLRKLGRVQLVDGDMREIIPGVAVYTGGKHTFASQYVGVNTRSGTVIIASDNAYLYENLEKKVAINQTLDAASNLAAQARMLQLAGSLQRIVPGHDGQVFTRFPVTGNGRVARID